ncbi:hypothetical protein HW532_20915 [Kaustia mangrovi]|uniref:Uncharacterized protein n=1 Tax=Kaustia mangrovi TaxID=2593653 RepID=A0A7S8C7R6_9HYPH|nr:hypothetical protein [Kaustia mangrovi]QPC44942.1 hypothetical protein HW532_20915 [Kaustia mangrovi]
MTPHFEGIDLDGLAHEADTVSYPPVVPGRTVHIDADFLAYMVTAEKADGSDEKTFEDMQHNAEIAVEALRGLGAAERVHLHLTPSSSNKGGRYDQAIIKEYQANRKDKQKPRHLNIMRKWLADRFPGTLHEKCEADDGMAAAQYAAIEDGASHLSIIASKDKDLRMVPGFHVDWDTGAITECSEFGSIKLVERVSASGTKTKKLVGEGQKYFWAQMLTGDPADNISGLPALPGVILNRVKPTKAVEKAQATLKDPDAGEATKMKAQAKLDQRKAAACGPVLAHDLIASLPDNKSCFHAVKALYRLYGEQSGYTHWLTGKPVHWGQVFASEGQLLWMRKQPHNENDVLNWWRAIA